MGRESFCSWYHPTQLTCISHGEDGKDDEDKKDEEDVYDDDCDGDKDDDSNDNNDGLMIRVTIVIAEVISRQSHNFAQYI